MLINYVWWHLQLAFWVLYLKVSFLVKRYYYFWTLIVRLPELGSGSCVCFPMSNARRLWNASGPLKCTSKFFSAHNFFFRGSGSMASSAQGRTYVKEKPAGFLIATAVPSVFKASPDSCDCIFYPAGCCKFLPVILALTAAAGDMSTIQIIWIQNQLALQMFS